MEHKEFFDDLSTALEISVHQQGSYDDYFNAAVLVPLIWDHDQLAVLFEVRSTHLSCQPGEVCFPGGRIEKTDESTIAAAVRETTEELGVEAEKITVLGELQEVISSIGVRLYPCVGYISDSTQLHPNSDEVAELFTVPLNFLLDAKPIIGSMERCTRPLADFPFDLLPDCSPDWKNRRNYQVLFYKYEQHVIWGLTAQVLHNFLDIYRKIKK
ncbi:NUDIX hydrolase [Candidatus Desulfosporosinus infrequens]|uniref:NUDIX hydrolase n=1 Tax=Candidatus Desulfosporosinus infrequens TaxID=2043169 RepID=A0A2U3LQ79_9FIRM|nr:NUDIX hydrolase [Candidatus Desulfosporosinus infrequens]